MNNSGVPILQPYYSDFGGVKTWSWVADPVGVGEVEAHQQAAMRVFPNPVARHTTVSFELKKAGAVHAEVLDITGKRVAISSGAYPVGAVTVPLDLSAVAAGMYFVRVSGAASGVQKVVVY